MKASKSEYGTPRSAPHMVEETLEMCHHFEVIQEA